MSALIQEQQRPSGMKLHCLEAAQWAILRVPNDPKYPQLEDNLETLMYYWEPRTVMKFIERECCLMDILPPKPLLADIATVVLEQLNKKSNSKSETFTEAKRETMHFK